jgi:hypothetical protein
MADHALTQGSDQRQRRKRRLSGAQRINERRNPFAVPECLRVNFPHGLVIFGPFLPDHQLNTSALKVVPWIHGARLAMKRSARDAFSNQRDFMTTALDGADEPPGWAPAWMPVMAARQASSVAGSC